MQNLLGPTKEARDLGGALSEFGKKLQFGARFIQDRALDSSENVADLAISKTPQELASEARDFAKRLVTFAEGLEKL